MPDFTFLWPLIWQSALLPFGVAAAVMLALRAWGAPAYAAAVALAAGLLVAYFAALQGPWAAWPRTAADALPWIAAAAALLTVPVERLRRPTLRRTARLALGLLAAALLVVPAVASFGVAKALGAVVAVALAVAVLWGLVARASPGPRIQPLLLAAVAGGAGLALMLDSSQSAGRLSGALAASLAACAVLGCWPQPGPLARPASGVAVLLVATLLAMAHLYAGFPLLYIALLAAALLAQPLVAALTRRPPAGAAAPLAAAVLTLIPVVATVALAVKAAQDAGGY
ncbi:hypothetical protein JI739_14980 [Ramlibacter sp. AW1]|uniref:Uncharacterized protein n=1 Tax=Ramlibacter aurantiacus TaxID=2801330 RepID=A0A936ZHR1_9BURK|nr:hypothetical protein [Ramlibacter aurantiacus]MBL0421659.1 hypothetical protein [Ramlibacter aurantiacus]